MTIAEGLLPEFDQETQNTRKMLARIPEDKLGWKPHEKSMDLAGLATHLGNMPRWTVEVLEQDSFDMAPAGGQPVREEPVTSIEGALVMFDRNVADARAAIASCGDERFTASWSLLSGGETIFAMPRIAVIRSMIMNHLIHHRGQLSVYLRLNHVPIPPMYGPTADEGPGGANAG
jgi:uncharacterized damage-inducible protein DinB